MRDEDVAAPFEDVENAEAVPLRRDPREYKLLAVDLDGTLLSHRGEPHARDVAALRALAASGQAAVSILTGRLYSGTRSAVTALGITGPVGCADGSHVVRASDHATLLHHGIRGVHAHKLRASVERHAPATFLFASDTIVHDARGEAYLGYVRTWSNDVRPAARVTEHDLWGSDDGLTAVVSLGEEAPIRAVAEEIANDLGDAAQVAVFPVSRVPGLWGLITRAAGGNKGSALRFLAEHHGIEPEQTVVVGDWLNDLPMFAVAGRSYAMGQAPDEVKNAASAVLEATSAEGGGIAQVVRELFGIEVA